MGMTLKKGRSRGSREAILRAAERIFAEEGLAGARTDAIARRAGVNKALLYYYFKSKEALYLAALERHMKEFNRLGLEVLSGRGTARSRLLGYVAMHFDFASSRPFFSRLFPRMLISEGSTLDHLVKKFTLPVFRKVVRVIEEGVKGGEFRAVDGRQTAISLIGLTVHYFLMAQMVRRIAHVDPYSHVLLERRKKEILDFVRNGLFRHPEAHWS
jgi:TetR/AcrR family transcriptional regulator